ncbi:hypothetical protein P154DRAFT_528757 [Amniculicola lignicola CBS 123094]|uniref:Uncharacterized protein n=1 Tax=Amniculicola lignicola CBS 123094 TaxID=1392246 RepID=A0A6A5X5P4_9PLEO|nr:hypothetical protein P154DRAFT_528757 [Amniculicola lignicola CBS 123094]
MANRRFRLALEWAPGLNLNWLTICRSGTFFSRANCPLAHLPACQFAQMPTCPNVQMPACLLASLPACPLAFMPTCPPSYTIWPSQPMSAPSCRLAWALLQSLAILEWMSSSRKFEGPRVTRCFIIISPSSRPSKGFF